jgi:hypothetical protein
MANGINSCQNLFESNQKTDKPNQQEEVDDVYVNVFIYNVVG